MLQIRYDRKHLHDSHDVEKRDQRAPIYDFIKQIMVLCCCFGVTLRL
jgi:hypothetical protein